ELTRSQRSLLRPEIQFVVDKAESFDLKQRYIITQSGKHYPYDLLVFATGCVPWPERIEGLSQAGDHFYQYQAARRLAHKLATIEKGRIFIT
ncbi:NAD(P)/FAD-dependent oxidoreductase, partial [Salmonella enterica]|nr:NAD(P)/FAD-dependent oxidoreductase [Salmonella enterica]